MGAPPVPVLTSVRLPPMAALWSLLHHPHSGRERILAFQLRGLQRLAAHAYAAVPYYRQLFDRQRLRPADIQGLADLAAVPITTKDDLRARAIDEVVARGVDPQRLITHVTSGSSGEPFAIRRTWSEERLLGAFRLRALHGLGLRPTDRLVSLGIGRPLHPRDHQGPQRAVQALGLYRRRVVSYLRPPAEVWRALRDARPDVVTGSPAALCRLAEAAGDVPAPVRPRFVASGGEVLDARMRALIGRVFGAPVFDLYGTYEFNLLAWECRSTGLFHVCDDNVILEILRDGQPVEPGETGEVVVTGLHGRAMPFLRYRLGDLATRGPEPCPCGRPFATISAIQGRTLDYFPLPDGRLLHPYELIRQFVPGEEWIRRYRLVQERTDQVTLLIAPLAEPPAERLRGLRSTLTSILGPAVALRIALVSDIGDDPVGKSRVAYSLVTSAPSCPGAAVALLGLTRRDGGPEMAPHG